MVFARPSKADLVIAVCHEVGNHLAAIRLSANLAAEQSSEKTADDLDRLSGSAGQLLAQVRFLLSDNDSATHPVELGGVVRDVRFSLGDALDGPVEFVFAAAADVPAIRFDHEALSRQIRALISDAAAAPDCHLVEMSYDVNDRFVVIHIDDSGAPMDSTSLESSTPQPGRALSLQLVRAIVEERGGSLAVGAGQRGTRVSLSVPKATP